MSRNVIKEIIYTIIAVLIGVIAVKFVMWLLPVIVVGILAYLIYRSIKKNKVSRSADINKKRTIKVIHELDDEE